MESHDSQKEKEKQDFFTLFFIVQGVFILLFGLFLRYGSGDTAATEMGEIYAMWQDVHCMIYIGFGFLMTFLRRYGYSAVGFNMLVAVMAFECYLLVSGFVHCVYKDHWARPTLSIKNLVFGDFAAAAVLISLGGILGKVSPSQILVVGLLEIVFYTINEKLVYDIYKVADVGGSMVIHTFGAYFGLAVSFMTTPNDIARRQKDNAPAYRSDLFSMIGTILLWLYWPSFNGATAGSADARTRAVVNTVLSLCASTFACFVTSRMVRHGHKFEMVDIQNATLAGGVAMGTSADMMTYPFGALLIGSCAGIISTLGFRYLSDIIARWGVHDTCGIHNLHGMPGFFGGLAGVIVTLTVPDSAYGGAEAIEAVFLGRSVREKGHQVGYQLAALLTTLGIALVSGLIVGKLVSLPALFNPPQEMYSDAEYWQIAKNDHEDDELPDAHLQENGVVAELQPAVARPAAVENAVQIGSSIIRHAFGAAVRVAARRCDFARRRA